MRISEYRDLLREVWDLRASLVSAATDHERRLEWRRLRDAVQRLQQATPRHAKLADLEKAARTLGAMLPLIAEYQQRFKAADAMLARLSFGEEWR